jgi:hypothetical protein
MSQSLVRGLKASSLPLQYKVYLEKEIFKVLRALGWRFSHSPLVDYYSWAHSQAPGEAPDHIDMSWRGVSSH